MPPSQAEEAATTTTTTTTTSTKTSAAATPAANSDSDDDFHDAADGSATPSQAVAPASQLNGHAHENKPAQVAAATAAAAAAAAAAASSSPSPPATAPAASAGTSPNGRRTEPIVVQAVEVANDLTPNDDLAAPEHPLRTMQGPFEESILESASPNQRPVSAKANAEARRQKLLNSSSFDDTWTTRWKQRPGATYHPLLKLMAQITFGMHLLQQNQAKSDQEVVKILQTHVDEVDTFLEQTAEDFDLAIKDVDERIQFLKLPMQHAKVFDIMLDDKQFRTQLLDGNDKIERIIDRTARAMNAALLDVQKGRQATRELSKYLNAVQFTWPSDKPDLGAIYTAMRGNEEGWKLCYKELQSKGNHLGNKLIELGTAIGEMSKMAAAASRRNAPQSWQRSPSAASSANSNMLRSRFNVDPHSPYMTTPMKDKPLPLAPGIGKPRPASFHQRFERPREHVSRPSVPSTANTAERPKTSSGPQSITDRANTFGTSRRASAGLSSHPPELARPRSAGNELRGSARARNAGDRMSANRPSTHTGTSPKPALHSRAQSAGAPVKKKKADNRESLLANTKDAISSSAFARRWSIRGRHPGPQPDDAVAEPPRVVPTSKPIASRSQHSRLPPVKEQPGKASLERSNGAPVTREAVPQPPLMPPPEPKSRTTSLRLGRNSFRTDLVRDSTKPESVHTGAESVSIASSIKRRTKSFKNIFSRRS